MYTDDCLWEAFFFQHRFIVAFVEHNEHLQMSYLSRKKISLLWITYQMYTDDCLWEAFFFQHCFIVAFVEHNAIMSPVL